jgi:hypothetical protein
MKRVVDPRVELEALVRFEADPLRRLYVTRLAEPVFELCFRVVILTSALFS